MVEKNYEKKLKAAKKYLGQKWCLHPANHVRRIVPAPSSSLLRYLENVNGKQTTA